MMGTIRIEDLEGNAKTLMSDDELTRITGGIARLGNDILIGGSGRDYLGDGVDVNDLADWEANYGASF